MSDFIHYVFGLALFAAFPTPIYVLHMEMKKPINPTMAHRRMIVYCAGWFLILWLGISGLMAFFVAHEMDYIDYVCDRECTEQNLDARVANEVWLNDILNLTQTVCWNKWDDGCVQANDDICYTGDRFVCDNLYYKQASGMPLLLSWGLCALILFGYLRIITPIRYNRKPKEELKP